MIEILLLLILVVLTGILFFIISIKNRLDETNNPLSKWEETKEKSGLSKKTSWFLSLF